MLPVFPEFKNIELSDREDIEKITRQFASYSDFNFVSLWSWDTKREMGISTLHGNLVVRFSDYLTGDPFFSFIGATNTEETISTLLAYDREHNDGEGLKLVPQEMIEKVIQQPGWQIFEDEGHADYIYDVDLLVSYGNSALKKQRNLLSAFARSHGQVSVKTLDLATAETQEHILRLYRVWENSKNTSVPHESNALKKCLAAAADLPIFGLGVFDGDQLIAFSINEIEERGYAACFFAKADTRYTGVYAYLMNVTARYLHEKGVRYLNYEQDLGLYALRKAKRSFAPVYFLKKNCIVKSAN